MGIPYYLENKECEQIAIDYCVFFLRRYPESNILDFSRTPEVIERINWAERRMFVKELNEFTLRNRDLKETFERTITAHDATVKNLIADIAKIKGINDIVIESKTKLAELEKIQLILEVLN